MERFPIPDQAFSFDLPAQKPQRLYDLVSRSILFGVCCLVYDGEGCAEVHLSRLAFVLISFYIDAMERCRLCTTNDVDGLIEEIAQELWASFPKDVAGTWADAEGYWQHVMRSHARVMVNLLRDHHSAHDSARDAA